MTSAYFEDIKDKYLDALEQAKHSIVAAVAWFTDRDFYNLLERKCQAGVKIKLLIVKDEINFSGFGLNFNALETQGVSLFTIEEKLMHHKFCVIDEKTVITGSYNWTRKASNENYENIAITTDDTAFAENFLEEFERIVNLHFKQEEKPVDIAGILKRLNVIKDFIVLNDLEDIAQQIKKLNKITLPDEVNKIVQLLQEKQFGNAIGLIENFINKHQQLASYSDTEIFSLQLELNAITVELNGLENEKDELERMLHQFSIRHSIELGDIITEILLLQKQKAESDLKENPEDIQQQKVYEEAEKDYEEYQKTFTEKKQQTLNTLTEEEQLSLKEYYRKCSKLCHPDMVSEKKKPEAARLFNELKNAYDANDMGKVKEIFEYLHNGKPFTSLHTSVNNKIKLRGEIRIIRNKIKELITMIQQIKNSDIHKKISKIDDWDKYFKETREELLEKLKNLKAEEIKV